MSLIAFMEVKIACTNNFSLTHAKIRKCCSFTPYGVEAISSSNFEEIKDLIEN